MSILDIFLLLTLIILFVFGALTVTYFCIKLIYDSIQITELMLGVFSLNISVYFLFLKNLNVKIIDILFDKILLITIIYFTFLVFIIIYEEIKNHIDNNSMNENK